MSDPCQTCQHWHMPIRCVIIGSVQVDAVPATSLLGWKWHLSLVNAASSAGFSGGRQADGDTGDTIVTTILRDFYLFSLVFADQFVFLCLLFFSQSIEGRIQALQSASYDIAIAARNMP